MMEPRRTPIFPALTRPNLWLGCDRVLLIVLGFVAVVIGGLGGVAQGRLWALPIALVLFVVGMSLLRAVAKRDPQAREVLARAREYDGSYVSRPRWNASRGARRRGAGHAFKRWLHAERPGTSDVPGLSDLLAYSSLVGDGVALLGQASGSSGDGGLLAGYWLEGLDLEAAPAQRLESLSAAVSAALRRLGDGWMVQVDLVRTARQVYERGDFVESVDALVDEERASDGRYFVNMVALWITYTPSALQRVSGDRFGRWMFGEVPQHELSALEARLAAFEAELSEVERALGESMGVKRMRSTPDNDELLQGLHLIVNGRWQPCRPLRRPVDLGALLARDLVWSTSSADAIQHADSFVEVVGILEMPKCSVPQMLHSLSSLGCELRWSSRFIMLDYGGARSTLKRLESNWANQAYSISPFKRGREVVNRDAYDREQEAKAALSQIEDRAVRYGHYTSVVVARGQSRAEAKARVALVASALERAGFMIKVEGINRIEALLGSMPGHGVQNVRKPMVHSLHFSDLLPLGREWSGSETCPSPMFPEDSPALIQARSWGGSMFFLNLHQGDLGHTLVLGPSGAGKSTLLASIVSQWMRYAGSQVIVFDQGRSMAALTLARRDGAFFALGSEEGIRTCPLADIDSEEERAWAVDWVESLCTMQGVRLSPEQRQRIFLSMGELAESTSAFEERASRRTLTHFAAHIIDDDIKSALHYYTSGPGAMVLNGDSDRLKYARLTTLELERLIECDPRLVKPTLLYLFRQVERRLDGRPTLVVMDEAWRYLDDPVFEARLKAWLKKFRKRNCAVIFATQQLSDVATSRIGEVIFESCPTRILLPNEQATVAMKRLYRDVLSLSEEQVQLLSTIARKRWYMYVDSSHSRVFTLDLGPVARAFCGASTMDDLEMIWSLVRAHGFAWPVAWLQARGLEQAAERFVELELQRASRAAVMKSGSCTDQPAAESST